MVPVMSLGDLAVTHAITAVVGSMAGFWLRGYISRLIKRLFP